MPILIRFVDYIGHSVAQSKNCPFGIHTTLELTNMTKSDNNINRLCFN